MVKSLTSLKVSGLWISFASAEYTTAALAKFLLFGF
jgi:hypothetical protein